MTPYNSNYNNENNNRQRNDLFYNHESAIHQQRNTFSSYIPLINNHSHTCFENLTYFITLSCMIYLMTNIVLSIFQKSLILFISTIKYVLLVIIFYFSHNVLISKKFEKDKNDIANNFLLGNRNAIIDLYMLLRNIFFNIFNYHQKLFCNISIGKNTIKC